nr:unnamed protein product [Digitaria exilis]
MSNREPSFLFLVESFLLLLLVLCFFLGANEAEVEAAPSLLVGEVPPESLGHLVERPVAGVVGVVVVGVAAEEAVRVLPLDAVEVDGVGEHVAREARPGLGLPVVELRRDPAQVRRRQRA